MIYHIYHLKTCSIGTNLTLPNQINLTKKKRGAVVVAVAVNQDLLFINVDAKNRSEVNLW
jgi:hypothetical protein